MPDEDKTFSCFFVLDLRISWRQEHTLYMLLWFHLVIPSFPARIDDMRSRFSALSILEEICSAKIDR